MTQQEFIVVFDYLDVGLPNWWFALPGLIFVLIGFILVKYQDKAAELFGHVSMPWFMPVFAKFWLWFSIIWCVLASLFIAAKGDGNIRPGAGS